mgnify:CR=1 FL=1
MNKYTIFQKILLYLSIAVFLTFILLPFVEMFYASLRPLKHLFRSPYQFYSNDLSFWAYSEMWNTVPRLGRYIFNSFFLASIVSILTLLFVIPADYCFGGFYFEGFWGGPGGCCPGARAPRAARSVRCASGSAIRAPRSGCCACWRSASRPSRVRRDRCDRRRSPRRPRARPSTHPRRRRSPCRR